MKKIKCDSIQIKDKYYVLITPMIYNVGFYLNDPTIVNKLAEDFEELNIVRGYITYTLPNGDYTYKLLHQWLENKRGIITDPAFDFYIANDVQGLTYHILEGEEVIVGKCLNCGTFLIDTKYPDDGEPVHDTCSDECNKEYLEYLSSPNEL